MPPRSFWNIRPAAADAPPADPSPHRPLNIARPTATPHPTTGCPSDMVVIGSAGTVHQPVFVWRC
jgi:hypothetical protein